MSSTHYSLNYHIVFSTKNRDPIIASEWRERLHAFLGGAFKTVDGVPLEIGGVADHVHILATLKPVHCLADVLQDVKTASSKWVHKEIRRAAFHWQDGYGSFTVSPSNLEKVRTYIKRQEQHHRRMTFIDEYRQLLEKNGVKYDERYLL